MKIVLFALMITGAFSAFAQTARVGKAQEFTATYGATVGMSRLCTQGEVDGLAKQAQADAVQTCKDKGWTYCYGRSSKIIKNVPKYNVYEGTTCEVRAYVDGVFYQPI